MGLDMDAVAHANEEAEKNANSGGVDWYAFKEGPNQLRILPPFGERKLAWIELKQCYNVGPNKKSVIPRGQFGLPCPLQDRLDELYKLGDPVSKKTADMMYPKNRVLLWVVDRDAEDVGPQLLNINVNVYRDILAIIVDPDYGDITCPEKGTDLNIKYTDKKNTANGFPDWAVLPKRNSTPLGNPEWLLEDLFEKNKIGTASEIEYIQHCLAGTEVAYLESLSDSGTAQAAPKQQSSAVAVDSFEEEEQIPFVPDAKWWVATDAGTVEMQSPQVQKMVDGGNATFNMMKYDQSGGWGTPDTFGFFPPKPAAPPPPPPTAAAPPSPPAPPEPPKPPAGPPSPPTPTPAPQSPQVSGAQDISSEEADLQKQLEDIRAKSATSEVGDDLRNQLK